MPYLHMNLFKKQLRLLRKCQTLPRIVRFFGTSAILNFAEIRPWLATINHSYCLEESYSALLRDSTATKVLEEGQMVHGHMIKNGFQLTTLSNKLSNMYVKCGNLADARQVFDEMPQRDVVSWNSMIAGYSHHGNVDEAFSLFIQMQRCNAKPDEFTFGSVLRACSTVIDLEFGKMVYGYILRAGFGDHVVVGCGLVDMHAKCYEIEVARQVFDEMPQRDVVGINAMIAGYVYNGCDAEALQLFCQLQHEGMETDPFTFSSTLSACANLGAMDQGKVIHADIIKTGIVLDITVGNALITMYAKSGSLDCAFKMFKKMPTRNAVSWNAMIAGCAHHENNEETLKIFSQMKKIGVKPNLFTFAGVLKVSTSAMSLEQGKQIHASAIKSRLESDVIVGSALLDMYAKCSILEDAYILFDKMLRRNVISWTTMISAYAHNGQNEQSVKLFSKMQFSGMEPNPATFSGVLMACASLASLKGGTQIHAYVIKGPHGSNVSVGNALVDMYSKCGSIDESCKVFDRMPQRDRVSWTAMITGCSQHGHGREAIRLFEQMQLMGMKPDHITFVGVISACSHTGLVDEGIHYFKSIIQDYGITPTEEHYNCMSDLLSRAGLLDEAMNFITKMPFTPGAFVWGSLLAACRIHGNIKLPKYAATRLLELEPHRGGSYVQLSNIYAAAGQWEDKAKVIKIMKDKGVKKETGQSWIDIKDKTHKFSTADRSHPQAEQIYAKLEELTAQMKQAGYVPNANLVMRLTS